MKRTAFCLFFTLFFLTQLFSQEISVYGGQSLFHADNLCDIEYTGCDWTSIHKGSLLGYAYHPSGKLWMILDQVLNPDQQQINIFETDVLTCHYDSIYSFLLPKFRACVLAANIDFKGRIYLAVIEWDSATHKSLLTISRINNPKAPTLERLFIVPKNFHFFEIHFQNNKIYIPEIRKPYIYVLDTSFTIIDTIITQKHVWGLTSISYGCDSVNTLATHMSISTDEWANMNLDSIMYISEYNLDENVLIPICNYDMGSKADHTFLTSPLEFLSSDPECDLLLDLDRNNSTGVYPYDYFDSTTYCSNLLVSICDDDLYLHTSSPLDSIRLTIKHPYDFSAEQLTLSPLPAGFTFIARNDSTYVLIKNGASDAEYRNALLQIRYSHPGLLLNSGERRITVQGFNAIKSGKLTTCFLHLRRAPYAGMDATLLLCRDTIISSFSSITLGQLGGNWSPALASGADLFNSTLDVLDRYAYFINDPVCGSDTALVTIVTDSSPHPDLLGPDQKLCPDDSLSLSIQGAASILWDDGSSNPLRMIYSPGEYWLASTTPGGCTYKDSITVSPGYAWPGIFTTTDPTCHQNNGEILIDSSAFVGASQVIFNGNPTNGPKRRNLAAGIHTIKVISNDHCVSEFEVELFDTPVISVSMDSVISIPSGTWGTLPVSFLNSIQPVDVHFTPSENIEWNNSTMRVFGDHDAVYEITFTDENGCTDVHRLHVKVEQLKGLYLPNIFHPGSYNGNDFWTTTIYPPYQLEVVRVYDRWGNLVYQSSDEIRWNGSFKEKECTSGVYVYQLWLRDQNTGERKNLTGDLTLVR